MSLCARGGELGGRGALVAVGGAEGIRGDGGCAARSVWLPGAFACVRTGGVCRSADISAVRCGGRTPCGCWATGCVIDTCRAGGGSGRCVVVRAPFCGGAEGMRGSTVALSGGADGLRVSMGGEGRDVFPGGCEPAARPLGRDEGGPCSGSTRAILGRCAGARAESGAGVGFGRRAPWDDGHRSEGGATSGFAEVSRARSAGAGSGNGGRLANRLSGGRVMIRVGSSSWLRSGVPDGGFEPSSSPAIAEA